MSPKHLRLLKLMRYELIATPKANSAKTPTALLRYYWRYYDIRRMLIEEN